MKINKNQRKINENQYFSIEKSSLDKDPGTGFELGLKPSLKPKTHRYFLEHLKQAFKNTLEEPRKNLGGGMKSPGRAQQEPRRSQKEPKTSHEKPRKSRRGVQEEPGGAMKSPGEPRKSPGGARRSLGGAMKCPGFFFSKGRLSNTTTEVPAMSALRLFLRWCLSPVRITLPPTLS